MCYSLKELEYWNESIEEKAKEFGLDYYQQEFEIVGFNEMLGYEAYLGMPSRYPHWSFGKSYEKNKTLYSYNLTGLPYEMVINSDPCLAYLMKDNTLLLQILTMAHVYGHNDFFKNNRMFRERTVAKHSLEMFRIDAKIIREYINSPGIGYQRVERVLDAAHSIRYNIGAIRFNNENKQEIIKKQMIDAYEKSKEKQGPFDPDNKMEFPNLDKIPLEPEEDVVEFIIQYGKLEEWEKDVVRVVKRETEYFMPQVDTKIINEGWASYIHYNILKELNLPEGLYFEFIKRHNDVVAPVAYGLNPYFIGFKIFEDLEKRYGRGKILEAREIERDSSFIRRYLTRELSEELKLFQYSKKNFEFVIEDVSDEDGWKPIRDSLSQNCGLGAIPSIRVIDLDKKDYLLTLEHIYDGRELELNYAKETLKHLQSLWGGKVRLFSKTKEGRLFTINCDMENKITVVDGNKI